MDDHCSVFPKQTESFTVHLSHTQFDIAPYLRRYQAGEWRAPIFHDAILQDIATIPHPPKLLDIGCGQGFDTLLHLQTSLSTHATGGYIGIEPDKSIPLAPIFSEVYHCCFEDAPIQPESIDIAFAYMVLEHIQEPELFWNKIYEVLHQGGIFWAFTMDARHYFTKASMLFEYLGLKDAYLDFLHGKNGENRYENYPTQYLSNSPKQIQQLTKHRFSHTDVWTFGRIGQLDYYYPRGTKWISHMIDRISLSIGMAGSVLVIRAVK